jgi:hypothetical protein
MTKEATRSTKIIENLSSAAIKNSEEQIESYLKEDGSEEKVYEAGIKTSFLFYSLLETMHTYQLLNHEEFNNLVSL